MKKFSDKINESVDYKIPTAEEFLKRDESGIYNEIDIIHAMIEFTKLHVEAALKSASEEASVNTEPDYRGGEWSIVDTDSILNAYSLDNIK